MTSINITQLVSSVRLGVENTRRSRREEKKDSLSRKFVFCEFLWGLWNKKY